MKFGLDNFLDEEEDTGWSAPDPKYHLRKPITPYLCSTPDDFNEERDFLVQKIFPEIHELCQLRGGNFFPVDIRWSPDDDQANTGTLLKLNLDYICKCSPYMICLLGESYGPYRPVEWKKLPEKFEMLGEESDWRDRNYMMAGGAGYTWVLKETHQNTSLTELEIIQASFLNDNTHCQFYFRQPEHLAVKYGHLPQTEREKCSQVHLPENEYADLNIRDLKQRIVKKALSVKYFCTLEELGRHVIKDWTAIIDIVYPPLERPVEFLNSEEYKDWISNEMFADSRCKVFLTPPELNSLMSDMTNFANSALDEIYSEQEEQIIERPYSITNLLRKKKSVEVHYTSVMVLHGDRGSGKSTVIANWLKKFGADNREIKVIHHYVGCSGRSKDITVFLHKVIKELREEYSDSSTGTSKLMEHDRPWTFQEICQAFISALSLGPSLIVLDGLDELGPTLGITTRQVKEFKWLPFPLPPQCRIVFTTCRSDLSYHSLSNRRDAKLVCIPSFESEKLRMSYLEEVMDVHYSNINSSNVKQVLDIKATTKPIFLNLLAVEMQSFSVYSNLTDYLDEVYEKFSSLRDFCVKCFRRWTQDLSWTKESLYGEVEDEEKLDLEGWIPDTLRLMAVSRTGLSEADIFTMLKDLGYRNTRQVKTFDWLQFRGIVKNFIYDQPNGQLQFGHQHLQEIVEYVLLHSLNPGGGEIMSANDADNQWKGQKRKFHCHLAKYFLEQPLSQRVIEELPWQLLMSGDIPRLLQILTDPLHIEFFLDSSKLNPSNKTDLAFYWAVLTEAGHDVVTIYETLLQNMKIMDPPEDFTFILDNDEEKQSVHSRYSPIPLQEEMPREATLVIPTIVTSAPRQRELSAVTEESMGNGIEIERITEDEIGENEEEEDVNTIFLTETESKAVEDGTVNKDLPNVKNTSSNALSTSSPRDKDTHEITPAVNPIKIAWLLSQFLIDLGHADASERILEALNKYLLKNYPLEHEEMLIHAKVQESLGTYNSDKGDTTLTEKYFRKSLRTVMDLYDMDEDSPFYTELQNLKGRLLAHIGSLRMSEGMLDSAEDLLREGLECASECGNITNRATILYNLGLLRMQQEDFVLSESFLRQALSIREQWFGKSHPLVADVIYHLASIMGNSANYRGFDRVRSENLYRRVLKIREDCLGKDHIAVSDTLFQLGKLLQEEYNHAAKNEAVQLLRRALDIRTTRQGGDHIDTRAVRQYLSKLEISLKMGQYEFGPAKPTDTRTSERPYSSLSWREKDLNNLNQKAKSREGSKAGSVIRSRPSSYKSDMFGPSVSRHSSMSHLSASEKLMMESERPRLLRRESISERKLKPSPPGSEVKEPMSQSTIEIKIHGDETERKMDEVQHRNTDSQIDSFGEDINETENIHTSDVKRTQFVEPSDKVPFRLFNRYSSAGSSRSSTSKQYIEKNAARGNSARSYGSSHVTGVSYYSKSSLRSNQSKRSVQGPHAITSANTRSVTVGPNSGLDSLVGKSSPCDISKNVHHRSAWYHVPGRYATSEKPIPPKRSQKTKEVHLLEQRLTPSNKHTPSYYITRKPPSSKSRHTNSRLAGGETPPQNLHPFGMTVKRIGPVISSGYYSDAPQEYAINDDFDVGPQNTTVKFKEAIIVE